MFNQIGPRGPLNTLTSVVDASFVYGASKERADKLRAFKGGLLNSNPVHRAIGLKDLLPPKLESPDVGCIRPNKDVYCFFAGDHLLAIKILASIFINYMLIYYLPARIICRR